MTALLILGGLSLISLSAYVLFHKELKSVRIFNYTALSFKGLVQALCIATVLWGGFTFSPLGNTHSDADASALNTPPSVAAATSSSQETETDNDAETPGDTAVEGTQAAQSGSSTSDATANTSTQADTSQSTANTKTTSVASSSAKNNSVSSTTAAQNNSSANTAASSATSTPVATSKYKDGTFTGTAEGFKGPITVQVEVKGDKILSVAVVDQQDDAKWFNRANRVIPQSIVDAQSANVDTVSGATYSSRGIINAAAQAISNALN